MSKRIFALFAVLAIFLCACNKEAINQEPFGIYLVAGELPSDKNIDINKLALEETPILTLDDIEKYYWEQQVFVTKNDLLEDRINVPIMGLPYVAVANGKRIYMGKFWNAVSSLWPYSPSITINFFGADASLYDVPPDGQLYAVYWDDSTPEAANVKKAVFDERIYKALKENNLLAENKAK